MAKTLGVSESGYYKWLARHKNPPSRKELEDIALTEEIWQIYKKSRGSFGIRQMTRKLNSIRMSKVNHKRVERLMRKNNLKSKIKSRYVVTTDSKHDMPIADNLLDRKFTANKPDEKMVSDTTEISTEQGKLYVAVIMDLYGRMPVGLAMSCNNDRFLVMDAFRDMISRGCGARFCFIHSDRGSTYCSADYRKLISKYDMLCSMSRKGDCWDNAPMESFWGKMKREWLKKKYHTINEAKRDVYEYVWSFYPRERPHGSNGDKTPWEYYCQ